MRTFRLQRALPGARPGQLGQRKYVISDPAFDEEDIIESGRKTIILDLDKPNDSEN